ncbi:MAG TPA: sugar phosphate nucleotidyltransferase [Longimicrobiales bacterium]|nr:sugar phosphate nucleotidyltransferase [Longimicrobiales bacterium]
MDAMILAAGLGTRLGNLTRDSPKALIDIAGTPILERVAHRLIAAGADRIIINLHHHAQQIIDFVCERDSFGVAVEFSHEVAAPLETGGGLLHAAPLIRRDAPFFLHNVDVLCAADLRVMYDAHAASGVLATLAVNERPASRYLLFDDEGLCGRVDTRAGGHAELHVTAAAVRRFAFAGIHVISPGLLDRITERGAFSIVDLYLRLTREGARIGHYDIRNALWLEIGSPERLAAARLAFTD